MDNLDKLMGNTSSNERIEVLKQELDAKKKELNMFFFFFQLLLNNPFILPIK